MKKKVAVITIIDYYNFGNRLQNYAVCKLLQSRFHCNVKTLEGYKYHAPYQGRILAWLKESIARQLCRVPSLSERVLKPEMQRWSSFENWSLQYIAMRRFYDCEKLPESLNDQFDQFFAGSDQIWNYKFRKNRFEDFFLKFASSEKRAAISASFGIDKVPPEKKQFYIDGLSGFTHISVREDAGAGIIKELLGKDVPVLCGRMTESLQKTTGGLYKALCVKVLSGR